MSDNYFEEDEFSREALNISRSQNTQDSNEDQRDKFKKMIHTALGMGKSSL